MVLQLRKFQAIGKSLRSVRSKLVREEFIAQEKTKSNKPKEPTKNC